jgi:ubiquinone/menaquinone biosynthesis C-methylase UbiE
MIEEAGKRHEHRGRSSRGILEPEKILKEMDLKGGDRLLDAGCGDGYFSIAASPMVGKEGRVYAVDSDGAAISELKSKIAALRITNLEAHVADISKGLPLADKSVNSVLLANVLHGLVVNGEAEGALREMARVVSTGGKLSVVEFKKMEMPMGPPLSIRLSPEQVEGLMVKYGFRKEKVIEAGPYHYQMVLVRD